MTLPLIRSHRRHGRQRAPRQRVLGALGVVAAVAFLATWAVTLRPQSLGGPAQYVVIHGNSMWPTYHDGDLIITHDQAAYRVGEVVAYRVPRGEVGAGHVVIHRIAETTATGLVLHGDNNPHSDPWHPTGTDVVGSTWIHIPRLGRLLLLVHQPLVPAALAAVVVVVWILRSGPRAAEPTRVGAPAPSSASAATDAEHR